MHRELLLLVTVSVLPFLCVCGCSGAYEEATTQTLRLRETEENISNELKQLGWELSNAGVMWTGKYSGSELTPDMLKRLQGFQRLTNLDLSDQKLTADHVQVISEMDSLMQLSVAGTSVDDADLDTLNACPMLMTIDLRDTQVTPDKARSWVEARKTDSSVVIFCRNATIKTGSR